MRVHSNGVAKVGWTVGHVGWQSASPLPILEMVNNHWNLVNSPLFCGG